MPDFWPELLKLQVLERRGCLTPTTTVPATTVPTTTSTSTTTTTTTTSTTMPGLDAACVVPDYWPELLRRQVLERRGCPNL